MKTETIKLIEPVLWHSDQVTEIVLREPRASEYFQYGEPQLSVRNPDGSYIHVDNEAAIQGYLNACIMHEGGRALLNLLSLSDSMMVKEKLFDFFVAARQVRLPTAATSSPST